MLTVGADLAPARFDPGPRHQRVEEPPEALPARLARLAVIRHVDQCVGRVPSPTVRCS